MFIFGIQVDNDKLYSGIKNRHSTGYSPIFINFSFFLHFSLQILPQLYKIESSYLVYRITTTSSIVG